jgi:hypothetical protein
VKHQPPAAQTSIRASTASKPTGGPGLNGSCSICRMRWRRRWIFSSIRTQAMCC